MAATTKCLKKKPHTKPCAGCPWRRKSLNGYLGASTPDNFVEAAMSPMEPHMPCHLQVNYNSKTWREDSNFVSPCAGRAIFLANQGIVPHGPGILTAPLIKPDTKTVFASWEEFIAHHKAPIKVRRRKKVKEEKSIDFFAGLDLPKDRIEAEIVRLKHIKPRVRRYSLFMDDHWAAIEVLTKRLTFEQTIDIYEEHPQREEAIAAADFISGDDERNSLTGPDGWAGLAN